MFYCKRFILLTYNVCFTISNILYRTNKIDVYKKIANAGLNNMVKNLFSNLMNNNHISKNKIIDCKIFDNFSIIINYY